LYKIIVFTHGFLAESLVHAAQMILGDQPDLEPYAIQPGDDPDALLEAIRVSIVSSNRRGQGVLVLTDMMFGTPFNTMVRLDGQCVFTHITGTNLPLLLEAVNRRGRAQMAGVGECPASNSSGQTTPGGSVMFSGLPETGRQGIHDSRALTGRGDGADGPGRPG
jgi:mannose/fructose-specific phosphotransferase system component IIA